MSRPLSEAEGETRDEIHRISGCTAVDLKVLLFRPTAVSARDCC